MKNLVLFLFICLPSNNIYIGTRKYQCYIICIVLSSVKKEWKSAKAFEDDINVLFKDKPNKDTCN